MSPHRPRSIAHVLYGMVAVAVTACDAPTHAPSAEVPMVVRPDYPRMERISPLKLTGPGDSVDLNAFVSLLSVRPRTNYGYVARLRPPPEVERYAWSVKDPDLIELRDGVAAAKVPVGRTITRARDAKGELVAEIPLLIGPLHEREVLVEFSQIVTLPEVTQRAPDLGTLGGYGLGVGSKRLVELSSEVEVSIGSVLRSRDNFTLQRIQVETLERRDSTVIVSGPLVLPLSSPALPPERLR